MRKIILFVLLVFGCDKVDTIEKECVASHLETRSHTRMIGKVITIQNEVVSVCDFYDFIYYDKTGVGWEIEIKKKRMFFKK